jgi:molybdate transport system permease protein
MSVLFPLRLSLQVAAIATIFIILIGVPIAYVLARRKFPGRDIISLILTLPMVLPPVVTGYLLLRLVGRNGVFGKAYHALTGHQLGITFTWQAAVIASFAVSFPFLLVAARAAIEGVDEELVNASYMLGRSEMETAWRVVIPMAGKGILAGTTLAFARAMGEFGATIMLAGNIPGKTNTMPLTIYNLTLYGSWTSALWMVLLFVCVAGIVMYVSYRLGRSALKA